MLFPLTSVNGHVARARVLSARTLAAFILICACAGDIVWENEPPDGGVTREGLTIRVLVAPEDSAAAAALGWSGRGVPQAEVWIEREGTDLRIGLPVRAIADEEGVVSMPDLIEGRYRVSALRVLTAEEVARAPTDRPDLRAFGGGFNAAQLGEYDLVLNANRSGLVVSEAYSAAKPNVAYIAHTYVEIYNNSDEAEYLDGMVLGVAHTSTRSLACDSRIPYQNDPLGIWARFFQKFPGTGTEYLLGPGAIAVVALDAIDHREVDPEFPDLRSADFEFRTTSDVDNPSVPDMIDYGTRASAFGGPQFVPGSSPPVLTRPFDKETLPRERALADIGVEDEFVRVPREKVLDVWAWMDGNPLTPGPICRPALNSVFDGLPFHWRREAGAHLLSQQRRVVGTTAGGRPILLNTGTSSVDLIDAPRTPGSLPDG